MNFTDEKQGCVIIEKLSNQRDAGLFCDIILLVNGEKFKAHRNVLAASSKYFLSVFKTKRVTKEKLSIDWCENTNVFRLFLNYIYTGIICINNSNANELLRIASKFFNSKLIDHCETFLREHLNSSNCMAVQKLAVENKIKTLEKDTKEFIFSHVQKVLLGEEELRFSKQDLESLASIANEEDLPQVKLLMLLCKWIEMCTDERSDQLCDLLELVNWENLDEESIGEIICSSTLLKYNKNCLYTLLNTSKKNNINITAYIEQYELLNNEFGDASSTTEINHKTEHTMETITSKEMDILSIVDDIGSSAVEDIGSSAENDFEQFKKRNRKSKHPKKVITTLLRPNLTAKSASTAELEDKMLTHKNDITASEDSNDFRDDDYAPEILSSDVDVDLDKNERVTRGRPKIRIKLKKTIRKKRSTRNKKNGIIRELRGRSIEKDFVPRKRGRPSIKNQKNEKSTNLRSRYLECKYSKQLFTCDKCSYSTESSEKLERHQSKIHDEVSATFKCKKCDFKCSWAREYSTHLKMHFEGPPYKCDECEFTSNSISGFSHHIFKHCNDRPYGCTQCGRNFKSKAALKNHSNTVHSNETSKFICHQCGMRYKTKYLLEQHLLTHEKDVKFLCDQCGHSTKTRHQMYVHVRIHQGKTIKCEFPGCDHVAMFKYSMIRHMKIHAGERPHKCSYCDKGFREKFHLEAHERIHLNERQYECEFCGYNTMIPKRLQVHVQKYHSDGTSKIPCRRRRKVLARVHEINSDQRSDEVDSMLESSTQSTASTLQKTKKKPRPKAQSTSNKAPEQMENMLISTSQLNHVARVPVHHQSSSLDSQPVQPVNQFCVVENIQAPCYNYAPVAAPQTNMEHYQTISLSNDFRAFMSFL